MRMSKRTIFSVVLVLLFLWPLYTIRAEPSGFNHPPVIGGDCDRTIEYKSESVVAVFSVYDRDHNDKHYWLIAFVDPEPDGSYFLEEGILRFFPSISDAGKSFRFGIQVYDRAGALDECNVIFSYPLPQPFKIEIGCLSDQEPGYHAYLPVRKTKGSEEVFGFDFLLGYDNSILTFLSAIRGQPYSDTTYQWEYFTYRYTFNGGCGVDCPSGLVRLIGIADENNGPHHALSFSIPDSMILFTLDFLVTNGYGNAGFHPVRFHWEDCGDNTIAFRYDDDYDFVFRIAVSDTIVDYNGDLINNSEYGFPGYYGVPDSCVYDPVSGEIVNPHFINFRNGGIEILRKTTYYLGDVNLNGRPYEIADCVVFTNYACNFLNDSC